MYFGRGKVKLPGDPGNAISEGFWRVFVACFTSSPGDYPLHETGCAPVPVICVGAGV